MAAEPMAPEDVRLILANGTEVPCEVRYVGEEPGSDGDPVHVWRAISKVPFDMENGDHFTIGTLPPRTSVELPHVPIPPWVDSVTAHAAYRGKHRLRKRKGRQ